nr:MAG TPA: hypothetical protein [Caudoviricetes sp.]
MLLNGGTFVFDDIFNLSRTFYYQFFGLIPIANC